MKKSILGFLAAIFMLAAPCANAGLGSFISSILPEPMRVSEINRKHFDEARTIMGIKRPAIIRNAVLTEDIHGFTQNYGPFSIIHINEYQNPDQEQLISTIYHETGHVFHNHHAVSNGSLVTARLLGGLALCAFITRAVRPFRLLTKASLVGIAAHLMGKESSVEKARIREHQAESTAITALSQAGHTDLLKTRLQQLQEDAQIEGRDARNHGEEYWTIDQEIALIRAALDKKLV